MLRWLGLAPFAGPALLRAAPRAADLIARFKPDRVVNGTWTTKVPDGYIGSTGLVARQQWYVEGIKKIGPGLERYMQVVYERTITGGERIVTHVTWLVRRGETIDGSTKYFR